MTPRKINQIQRLINSITLNEDCQQELWVAVLCGQSSPDKLQIIKQQFDNQELFQSKIRDLYSTGLSPALLDAIQTLPDIHRTIIFLLMLGYTIPQIGQHYSVGNRCIIQAIGIISSNSCWDIL